jgi:nitrogen fixation NifU-like protein
MASESSPSEIYDEHILDHYECPYHKGRLEHATSSHRDRNPLCGDVVQLDVQVDAEGRVRQAYFDGRGCAISQAAASMLCQEIEGKSLQELRQMQAQDVLELLKVPLTSTRQRCGLLCFRVLKTIVYELTGAPNGDAPVAAHNT